MSDFARASAHVRVRPLDEQNFRIELILLTDRHSQGIHVGYVVLVVAG
jgi:hypothetical protein